MGGVEGGGGGRTSVGPAVRRGAPEALADAVGAVAVIVACDKAAALAPPPATTVEGRGEGALPGWAEELEDEEEEEAGGEEGPLAPAPAPATGLLMRPSNFNFAIWKTLSEVTLACSRNCCMRRLSFANRAWS